MSAAAAEPATLFPPLLTTKDLCKILRQSRTTLERDIHEGKLPAPVLTGPRRWLPAAIQQWLAAGCPPRDRFEAATDRRTLAYVTK